MSQNSNDIPDQNENADDACVRAPAWANGAGRWSSFWHGTGCALRVPGWILLVSASGFGVLAHDAGLSLVQSFLVMALYFGLPAQIAVADQIARDGSIWAAAIAVALTGIRLLPMTVTLMPFLNTQHDGTSDPHHPGALSKPLSGISNLTAVHFVAVTAWLEGMRTLPGLPANLRVSHYIGIGTGLLTMTLIGTATGFLLVKVVPPAVGAVLLFVSPAYFLLSLIDTGSKAADKLAIVLGCALSPLVYLLLPDFDLAVAGLLGGTLAYIFGRYSRGLPLIPQKARQHKPPHSRSGDGGNDA